MTTEQARNAMRDRLKVEAGEGPDHDTGIIVSVDDEGMAIVAWQSGVRTPCPIADLEIV